MMRFKLTLRLLLFFAYCGTLLGIPFVIVAGWTGFLISLPLDAFVLYWLRFDGFNAIGSRLHAEKDNLENHRSLKGALGELSRRLDISVPEIYIISSQALNIGAFGFNRNRSALILTPAALALPRDELLSLIARVLVEIVEYRVSLGSWLSQFIAILEKLTGSYRSRRSVPFRVFLKEVILWPLTLIPFWCLRSESDATNLDKRAVQISTGSGVHLAGAFRKLELKNSRYGLEVPVSLRHLFLLVPRSDESAARSIFSFESLSHRISLLEECWLKGAS